MKLDKHGLVEGIIVMVGLPLSGKSTIVDEMITDPFTDHFTVICPDDVRMALYGKEYHAPAEKFVWATIDVMVRALLLRNQSLIIDATNKTRWERDQWYKLARDFNVPCRVIHVTTSADKCILRAMGSDRFEMVKIIERMAEKFEPLQEDERIKARII